MSAPLKKRGREDEDVDSEEDVWRTDLMGDEQDRQRLSAMNELEREIELDRRRRVREAIQERNRARQRLEGKGGGGGDDRVGKRGKMNLTEQRDARFQAFMDKEKSGMLPMDDEEEEEDAEEGELGDMEMEIDPDDELSGPVDVGPAVPLSQVLKVQGRRSTLVLWQDRPFFEKTVRGMYVKVRVGDKSGAGVYRMARVSKVERRATQYKLISEAVEKSNVHLLCSIGKATKRFKLVQVSNQDITEDEFKIYNRKQDADDLQPPGEKEINVKVRHVQAARNYRRSEAELQAKLEQILEKPLEELTMVQLKDKRAETEGLVREARDNKDRDELNNLTQQLTRIRELLDEKNPQLTRGVSSGSRYNARVKNKRIDPKEAAEYYADDDPTKANPFRRRRTVSSAMIVKTSAKTEVLEAKEEDVKAPEPEPEPEVKEEAEPIDEDVAKLQRSNVVVKRLGKSPKALAAEIAAEHEFELDIDI